MASINLSGILTRPDGEPDVGAVVRFTHYTTTGNTVKYSYSELVIPPDGAYNIDLEYGQVRIDYDSDYKTERFISFVVVNQDSTATSIPELLNASVPPTDEQLLEFQSILADTVAAKDIAVAVSEQITTTELINSSNSFTTGDVIETSGFTSKGDGGGAKWQLTSTNGTASQTPAQLGNALLNDADGRQWKLVYNYNINLEKLGFADLTPALRTSLVQGVIDALTLLPFGGKVSSPSGEYEFAASTLTDSWPDGIGGFLNATSCCIVNRPNVKIVGDGKYTTTWICQDTTKTIIYDADPFNTVVSDITLKNVFTASGGGHGYFQVVSDQDFDIKNVTIERVRVLNVGSYGIGLNHGTHVNIKIDDIHTYNTGSDGIDIKTRAPSLDIGYGNKISNVVASKFGQRLSGAVGVDIRGEWTVTCISAQDFGRSGIPLYGVRTRPLDSNANISNRSILSFIHVDGGGSSDNGGVVVSGKSTVLSGFEFNNCGIGLDLQESTDAQISNGVVEGSLTYAVKGATSALNTNISNVRSKSSPSATAHFRLEGTGAVVSNVTGDSTATEWSLSTASANSISRVGSDNSASDGVDIWSPVSGRARIQAKGISDNIDVEITPKGTGYVRYGTHSVLSAESITGYITVRDSSGALRKLAVIS